MWGRRGEGKEKREVQGGKSRELEARQGSSSPLPPFPSIFPFESVSCSWEAALPWQALFSLVWDLRFQGFGLGIKGLGLRVGRMIQESRGPNRFWL
jgi:hypothetical protein